jgi:hypothetical protein
MERSRNFLLILLLLLFLIFDGFAVTWDTGYIESDVRHLYDTNVDLVIDVNSTGHILYFQRYNTDQNLSLVHAYRLGDEWNQEFVLSNHFSDAGQYAPKALIDIDANGVFYAAYSDSDDKIYYLYNAGSRWCSPYTIESTGTCLINDMHVDSNSLLHIVYIRIPDGKTANESELVLAVGKEYDFSKTAMRTDGKYQSSSLAIDTNDHDHIVYYDYNTVDTLRYIFYDHTSVDDHSIESVGGSISFNWGAASIGLDSNDVPNVSYYHISDSDLKYATKPQTEWITETVDINNISGEYSSLSVDDNGMPHIFYLERTGGTGKLKYAMCGQGGWSNEIVEVTGEFCKYISCGIDSSGNAQAVYNIPNDYEVKFCMPLLCGGFLHPYPNADIDRDCRVDMRDMAALASRWAQSPCGQPDYCGGADLDQKGSVDNNDLIIINENWLDCIMPGCE